MVCLSPSLCLSVYQGSFLFILFRSSFRREKNPTGDILSSNAPTPFELSGVEPRVAFQKDSSFVWFWRTGIECFRLSVVKPKPKQFQQPIIARKPPRSKKTNKQTNNLKRGKTRVTKSRLVLVLNLIGSQSGASFLDQSYNEIEENQSNPRLYSTLNWQLLLATYQCNLDCPQTLQIWPQALLCRTILVPVIWSSESKSDFIDISVTFYSKNEFSC